MNDLQTKRQHYVPQFWLKGFADVGGHIYGLTDGKVSTVAASKVMQEHWLYTTFDTDWVATNDLETAFSLAESEFATSIRRLRDKGYQPAPADHDDLRKIIAIQATRHPDLMKRHRNLASDFAKDWAAGANDADLMSFYARMSKYGLDLLDVAYFYVIGKEPQFAASLPLLADTITSLIPQHHALPEQDAVRAWPIVEKALKGMTFTLLDAPSGQQFVLGDTPLPQADMVTAGFCLPLSAELAVKAEATPGTSSVLRRPASSGEIAGSNEWQSANAKSLVIGADPKLLLALRS